MPPAAQPAGSHPRTAVCDFGKRQDALAKMGRYEDAGRKYRKCIELSPDLTQQRQETGKRLQQLRSIQANL